MIYNQLMRIEVVVSVKYEIFTTVVCARAFVSVYVCVLGKFISGFVLLSVINCIRKR